MKNMNISRIFFALLLGAATSACAHKYNDYKEHKVSETTVQRHSNDRSTVVKFEEGSSSLSVDEQMKLRDMVASLRPELSKIEIAVWSDKEFPSSGGDLSKDDVKLAGKRAEAIKDYLKADLDFSGVDLMVFNMAETSNWLAKTFRTDDAEIKSVFAKRSTSPMSREDFNYISREGGPEKAIVVLVPRLARESELSPYEQ